MAYAITVDIVDPGDERIHVSHIFWGRTEAEARTAYTHHLAQCEYFQKAVEEGYAIEDEEEIPDDELPEADVMEEGEEDEEDLEDEELGGGEGG